ncbi:MAG TPA: dihydropteroate synthase [Bacteroidales bacterium]
MISKDTFFSKKRTLNFAGTLYELTTPMVMGILNITPDSFYEGSRYTSEASVLQRCERILVDGGAIIDIGAYSSRPGAEHISEEDELNRLVPALKMIRKTFPDALLSVDTFRANVAKIVVRDFGVQMINDISAGTLDESMMETVASLNVPYVMMHIKGDPRTMQQLTEYDDLIRDILKYFAEKVEKAKMAGVQDIIIDPGFGFGKTLEQNYQLLSRLSDLRIFELPVLVGISRKSMIYKLLEITADNSLAGTVAVNTLALLNGANILRVHDVKEAVDTVKIVATYKNSYL